jgi:hypothetical protein
MSPFEPGKFYRRVQDIHQRFGGQRQGGIHIRMSFCSPVSRVLAMDTRMIFGPTGHSGTQVKDKSET